MSDRNFDNDLPPWMQGEDDHDEGTDAGDETPLWDDARPGTVPGRGDDPFAGMTGNLPWNAQASAPSDDPSNFENWLTETGALNPDNLPAELRADEADTGDDLPDWLTDSPQAADNDATLAVEMPLFDATPEDADDDLPDWLTSLSAAADDPDATLAVQTPMLDAEDTQTDDDAPEPTIYPPLARTGPPAVFGEDDDDLQALLADDDFATDDTPAEDLPDWLLNPTTTTPETEALATDEDDLDWLAENAPAEDPATDETEETPLTFEEWAAQNDPEAVAPQDDLNWMADDTATDDDLTYEEWERQQEEAEYAAQHPDDDIPLPDEGDVPDWFADIDADAAPAPGGGAPADDYLPEWFMGVEELDDADAPDWLKGTSMGGASTPPPADLPHEDDVLPDFDALMGDLDLPADDDDLPDLDDITSGEAAPSSGIRRLAPSEPLSDPPSDAVALDDLLGDYDADDAEIDMPDLDDLGRDDAPAAADEMDWLVALAASAPSEPPRPEVAPPSAEDDAFSLDDLLGADVDLPTPGGSPMALPADDDLGFDDDFLADFGTTAPVTEPTDAPELAPAEGLAEGDVPEWMRAAASSASTGDEVMLKVGNLESRIEQVPPFLLSPELQALLTRSAAVVEQTPAQTSQVIDEGPLAGVENGLAVDPYLTRPGKLYTGEGAVDLSPTQELRLASIQRVLAIVQQEQDAHRIDFEYGIGAPEDDFDAPEPLAPPPQRRRRARQRIPRDRLVMTVLLLIALLVPFVTEVLHVAESPPTTLTEDAQPVGALVDSLPTDDATARVPVLVAFEYGSTGAQELDPLAEAVLRDILAHNGYPVVLSTHPLGILRAEQVMRELAQDDALLEALGRFDQPPIPVTRPDLSPPSGWVNARVGVDVAERSRAGTVMGLIDPPPIIPPVNLQPGEHYAVLRYLPGGAVSVRALTESVAFGALVFQSDISGANTNLEMDVITDDSFAFVVVVAERYDEVRIWAEQLAEVQVPKVALVSAAAEPLARPYLSADAYDGMLSGIQGALMYDAARNADTRAAYDAPDNLALPDPALGRWHGAALAALLASTLISLGALYNILRVVREGRRKT
ncbi:MAG: hypothetical protein ACLFTK_12795 [Anaerolineales bacterium]